MGGAEESMEQLPSEFGFRVQSEYSRRRWLVDHSLSKKFHNCVGMQRGVGVWKATSSLHKPVLLYPLDPKS